MKCKIRLHEFNRQNLCASLFDQKQQFIKQFGERARWTSQTEYFIVVFILKIFTLLIIPSVFKVL